MECWARGQGEDEVVVKMVFGMAASFMGIVLVCGGSYGLAVSVPLSDSEPPFTEPLTGRVTMALLFGFFLCSVAWQRLKHDD